MDGPFLRILANPESQLEVEIFLLLPKGTILDFLPSRVFLGHDGLTVTHFFHY